MYFIVFSLSVLLSWILRDYYASGMRVFPGAARAYTAPCLGPNAPLD